MGYISFKKFVEWVASGAEKNPNANRAKLIELANLTRQHIHLVYAKVAMAVDKEGCFAVQCFRTNCHDCADTYFGITLPGDMQGVEAVWRNSTPVPMFGRWRDASPQIGRSESCRLEGLDQGSIFPTELDPSFAAPCRLLVKCSLIEDKGKELRIIYYNHDGTKVDQTLKLDVQYSPTQDAVMAIDRPAGIRLPEDRQGGITIALESNKEPISNYSPFEPSIPAYKRLRLTGVCLGDQVLVKANAKYIPLYHDNDVAEFDNQLAVEEVARMLVYRKGKTAEFVGLARESERLALEYLTGQKSRERGSAATQIFIGGREVHRSSLSNRRKR